MPMWRCPHCGTPQAETARCWVCRRSSTACGTCRNFRSSVAGSLGYCGLDRKREALAGDEIRACWEPGPDGAHLTVILPLTVAHAADDAADRGRSAPREFIEIDGTGDFAAAAPVVASDQSDEPTALPEGLAPLITPAGETGWSLWGDVDR